MGNNPLSGWLHAVSPALAWLLLRYSGKGLPPTAMMILEGSLAALAWWLFCRENGRSGFRLKGKTSFLYIGLGILCGAVGRLCFGQPKSQENSFFTFFQLCIIGPASEEIIYRGLIHARLRNFLPEAGAVAVSSLLFAVAHETPAQMGCALAAGILFSWAFRKTGLIAVPVLMHMFINFFAFL